jgi:hypothetical protein
VTLEEMNKREGNCGWKKNKCLILKILKIRSEIQDTDINFGLVNVWGQAETTRMDANTSRNGTEQKECCAKDPTME